MAVKRLTKQELGQCEPAQHDLQVLTQPFVPGDGLMNDLVMLAYCKKCGNTAHVTIEEGRASMPPINPDIKP